jgi:uncharacterized HAD superfamily protein
VLNGGGKSVKMRRMRIGVDLDDVLADFVPALAVYHNEVYGTALTKESFWAYRFWDVLGITQEEAVKRVYDFLRSSQAKEIQSLQGSREAVEMLGREHELFVITARDESIAEMTMEWLTKHFVDLFSGVYFANHFSTTSVPKSKGDICNELGIDVVVDDSSENALDCVTADRRVLLFSAPWNANAQLAENIERVFAWEDILKKIR